MNAQQDLLDCDCRLPMFLLVQNRQADGAGWVDIRMEERGYEFAYRKSALLYTNDRNEEHTLSEV